MIVLVLGAFNELRNALLVPDLAQHVQDSFIGTSVGWSPQRSDSCGNASKGIGAGGSGHANGGSRGILLVIGMKNENTVHGPGHDRIEFVVLGRHRKGHSKEILRIGQVIAWIDEGL